MRLIGVKDERVTMLEREFFARKIPGRLEHAIRGCSRRHRKHNFVDKPRRLFALRRKSNATTIGFEFKIPILDQVLAGVPAPDTISGVSLKVQFTLAADVVEVPANRFDILSAPR
jgi:hypothetical protein